MREVAMNRARRMMAMGMFDSGEIPYLLRDDFTDTAAGGSVNGTLATPGGTGTTAQKTRTVTDGNNKLSVGSGVLDFATGGVNVGNPGLWYGVVTRAAGRVCVARVTHATNSYISLGWDTAQTLALSDALVMFNAQNVYIQNNAGSALNCGALTSGVTYLTAAVMRATGMHYLIKGGAFAKWTLIYSGKAGTGNLYPGVSVYTGTTTGDNVDFVRVPETLIVITPLASDNFAGAWGATGGGGSEESGGDGLTWTAQKGVFGSAAGVAACSELADSLGIATVPCGTADVMVEAVVTRSAGNAGLVLRWTDINNYIATYLDGTSLITVEVVAGTPNTLATTAVTYGATKRLIASLSATKIRLYYGDALVGAELTTAVVAGNAHGLYTSDIGATFDNFVVCAKGNGGEWAALDTYINP
jgi:hypothetical protein